MAVNRKFVEEVEVKEIFVLTKALWQRNLFECVFPLLYFVTFFLLFFPLLLISARTLSTCHCNITLHAVPRPAHHPAGPNTRTATTLSRILFSLRGPHEFRLHTKENTFSNVIIHTPNWITKIDTACWIDWGAPRNENDLSHIKLMQLWKHQCSWMWRRVACSIITDVSNEPTAFVLDCLIIKLISLFSETRRDADRPPPTPF
jgi:hypothetical protein